MSTDDKLTPTRKILQEKFGFTSNLPNSNYRLHDDVTDRNGKEGKNPAYLPVEEFRKQIKLLMGMTTTEEDMNLKDALDFRMLRTLCSKTGIDVEEDIATLEKAFEKRDKNLISKSWNLIKDKLPFWFLGMLTANTSPGKAMSEKNEELPENQKEALKNIIDVMEKINKESEKQGKAAAKNTPKGDEKTQAEKNLEKSRKSADMDPIKNKKPKVATSVEEKD